MQISDTERERLVALYPWVRDFDRVLRSARCFSDAVSRLKALPVRPVSEIGSRKRRKKV